MSIAAKLDHVAVAAESWDELWPRYAGDLGGAWVAGGPTPGFASAQVRYSNGMKVEALMPFHPELNDFLRRFLDHRGPGPHHLTFKVADITTALDAASAAGFRPVSVDLTQDDWKEAFLHPKDAPGVVVQLAQSLGEWESPPPAGFPEPRVGAACLDHIAHCVTRLDEGLGLFADLLGGEELERGHDDMLGVDWITLAWPGPGRIRLLDAGSGGAGSPVRAWIGDGPGRIHHLAFTVAAAAAIADAKPTDDGRYEIAPDANLGTRLVVTPGE